MFSVLFARYLAARLSHFRHREGRLPCFSNSAEYAVFYERVMSVCYLGQPRGNSTDWLEKVLRLVARVTLDEKYLRSQPLVASEVPVY